MLNVTQTLKNQPYDFVDLEKMLKIRFDLQKSAFVDTSGNEQSDILNLVVGTGSDTMARCLINQLV